MAPVHAIDKTMHRKNAKRISLYSEPEKFYPKKSTIPLGSLAKGEFLLLSEAQPTIEGSPTLTLAVSQPL